MKRTLAVVGIVVILAVLAGGYFVYQNRSKSSTQSPTAANSTGTEAAFVCKRDDQDLCKFAKSWKAVKYYTMEGTITDNKGVSSSITFLSVLPDRSQTILKDSSKEAYNTITIGNTIYIKDYADNQWTKQTITPSDSEPKYDLNFDSTINDDKITYRKIGKEACGNLNCFKYQVVDPAQTGTASEYIYFDDRQYQIRRVVTEEKDGSRTDSTIKYDKVTISEPSPTKTSATTPSAPSEAQMNDLLKQVNAGTQPATGGADTSSAPAEAPSDTTNTSE